MVVNTAARGTLVVCGTAFALSLFGQTFSARAVIAIDTVIIDTTAGFTGGGAGAFEVIWTGGGCSWRAFTGTVTVIRS